MQDAHTLMMLNAIGAACTAILAFSLFQIPKPESAASQFVLRNLRLAVVLWAVAFSCGSLQVVAKNLTELKTVSILLANIGYATSYFFIYAAVAQRYQGIRLGIKSWHYFALVATTIITALLFIDHFVIRNLMMPLIHIILLMMAIFLMHRSAQVVHPGDRYFRSCLIYILMNELVTNAALVQATPPGIATSLRVLLFILLNGIVLTTAIYALFLNDIIEKTKRDGVTDPLSGLFNRRFYVELISARRTPVTGAVILCDIDNFKRINDSYGHAAGDIVIQNFAGILKEGVQPEDIVIRFGGEEFVIILMDATLSQADRMATRLCENVANHLTTLEHTSLRFTASFGVAAIEQQGLEKAVQHADVLLYQAKSQGKNRVISA